MHERDAHADRLDERQRLLVRFRPPGDHIVHDVDRWLDSDTDLCTADTGGPPRGFAVVT